ncbi:MAG: glycosyltransferase [Nitrospirae bacterium]|nr:glycosyltransferase [Nitrospirota bacterium]
MSVIIPTYNRCTVLRKCLDALSVQSVPPGRFEVIVCDDGSTDDTAAMVKNYSSAMELRYLPQDNRGPASARNMGLHHAGGRWVLFLNDDAIGAPTLVEEHLRTLENTADDNLAVLGSFSFPSWFTASPFGYLLENTNLLFEFYRLTDGVIYDYSVFYTCNLSLPKSRVFEAGLFDEGFTGPSSEDIDLGYRLYKLGVKILYAPQCRTTHDHCLTPSGFCNLQITRGKGVARLFSRHPEINWYRGMELKDVERWQKLDTALKEPAYAVMSAIDSVDKLAVEALANDVATNKPGSEAGVPEVPGRLLPAVRFLQKYYARKGALSSPSLLRMVNAPSHDYNPESGWVPGRSSGGTGPKGVGSANAESAKNFKSIGSFVKPGGPSQVLPTKSTLLPELDAALTGVEDVLRVALTKEIETVLKPLPALIAGRHILVWGAGDGGARTLKNLGLIGLVVDGFVDGNPQKKSYAGLPVYSPSYLRKSGREEYFVFIGSMYADEIAMELAGLGFIEGEDFSPNLSIY